MKKEIKERIINTTINIICAIMFLIGTSLLIEDAGVLKLLAWALYFVASAIFLLHAEKRYGL
jgi:uncharacterized membrane protein (DUF2068 family)